MKIICGIAYLRRKREETIDILTGLLIQGNDFSSSCTQSLNTVRIQSESLKISTYETETQDINIQVHVKFNTK